MKIQRTYKHILSIATLLILTLILTSCTNKQSNSIEAQIDGKIVQIQTCNTVECFTKNIENCQPTIGILEQQYQTSQGVSKITFNIMVEQQPESICVLRYGAINYFFETTNDLTETQLRQISESVMKTRESMIRQSQTCTLKNSQEQREYANSIKTNNVRTHQYCSGQLFKTLQV
jgi:hypothetical protein